MSGFLFPVRAIHTNLDLIPPTQYSNIPSFQLPMAVDFGNNVLRPCRVLNPQIIIVTQEALPVLAIFADSLCVPEGMGQPTRIRPTSFAARAAARCLAF